MSWLTLCFAAYLVIGGALTTWTVACGSRLTFGGWILGVLAWPLILAIGPEAYRRQERIPLLRGPPRDHWIQRYPAAEEGLAQLLADGAGLGISTATIDQLRRVMQPDDELWSYSSPDRHWQALAGRAGAVVVRGGQVVHDVIAVMN